MNSLPQLTFFIYSELKSAVHYSVCLPCLMCTLPFGGFPVIIYFSSLSFHWAELSSGLWLYTTITGQMLLYPAEDLFHYSKLLHCYPFYGRFSRMYHPNIHFELLLCFLGIGISITCTSLPHAVFTLPITTYFHDFYSRWYSPCWIVRRGLTSVVSFKDHA